MMFVGSRRHQILNIAEGASHCLSMACPASYGGCTRPWPVYMTYSLMCQRRRQAFGMMGWRVGYLAYQDRGGLGEQLAKVQDTIPICPPQLSQYVALGALRAGRPWVASQLVSIMGNR